MTKSEYKKIVHEISDNNHAAQANELIEILEKVQDLIFMGMDEPQPLKWHQIKRIYALAQYCIRLIIILLPYIKMIIKWLK